MKLLVAALISVVPMMTFASDLVCGEVTYGNFTCDIDYCYAALKTVGANGQPRFIKFGDVRRDIDLGQLAHMQSACVPSDKIQVIGNEAFASVKDAVESK